MNEDESSNHKKLESDENSPLYISEEQKKSLVEYDDKEKFRIKNGKGFTIAQVLLALGMILSLFIWPKDSLNEQEVNKYVTAFVLIFFSNVAVLLLRLRITGFAGKSLDKSKIVWDTSTTVQKKRTIKLFSLIMISILLMVGAFIYVAIKNDQKDKAVSSDFDKKILEERQNGAAQSTLPTIDYVNDTIGVKLSYPSAWGSVVEKIDSESMETSGDTYWYAEFSSVGYSPLRLSGAKDEFANYSRIDDVLFIKGFDYNLFKQAEPNCPELYKASANTTCTIIDEHTLVYTSDVLERTGFKLPNYYIVRNLSNSKSGLSAIRLAYFGYAEIDGYPEYDFILSKDEFIDIAKSFSEL